MRTGLARAGWIVLIVLNIGMLLNHLIAIFFVATSPDEGRMFIAYAVVNALAVLVLFFAYPVRQRWAWASIWLVVLATGVTIGYGIDTIGLIYVGVAGVMALAQLATAREFFGAEHEYPAPKRDCAQSMDAHTGTARECSDGVLSGSAG